MQTILDELFDRYNRFVPNAKFLQEVENAHQQLRQSLEKPERILVLSLIDNKDLIAAARARESFACGFWLAWRMFSQLHNYDSGRSVEEILNVGGRFSMPKGEADDEPQT